MDQKKVSKIGGPSASLRLEPSEMGGRKSGRSMQLVAGVVSIVLVAGVLLLTNIGSTAVNTNGEELGTKSVNVIPKAQEGIASDIHGIPESATLSDYYRGGYTTKLDCRLIAPTGSFPVYCDGSPITISGLPEGTYTVEITGTSGLEIDPLSISFVVS